MSVASKKENNEQKKLAGALHDLTRSANQLRRDTSRMTSIRRDMIMSFLRGVAYVLGVMATVAVLVPIAIWLLRGIEWPPLIGDWVIRIIEQVEQSQQYRR